MDIPAVAASVTRFGRSGDRYVAQELDRLSFGAAISDLIHPQIKDLCTDLTAAGKHREVVNTSVGMLMDELRRLSRVDKDGDALIRQVVGTMPGKLAFSDCQNVSAKQVTDGLKLIAQGLYKGVRNPASHGWDGFGYSDALQIMVACSFLITRIQIVDEQN